MGIRHYLSKMSIDCYQVDQDSNVICTYYIYYFANIDCTVARNRFFYADCRESTNLTRWNLTMSIRYLYERYTYNNYPQYSCFKSINSECYENCELLFQSEYKLYLVQFAEDGKIEIAWSGLSNCGQPRIELNYDETRRCDNF